MWRANQRENAPQPMRNAAFPTGCLTRKALRVVRVSVQSRRLARRVYTSYPITDTARTPQTRSLCHVDSSIAVLRVQQDRADDLIRHVDLYAGLQVGDQHLRGLYLDLRCPLALLHAAGSLSLPRPRSEEHTSELQSRENLVCRPLLEKKKKSNAQ